VLGIGVAYVWAIRRLQPARLAVDDAPTSPREIALFFTGLAVLWLAADWPLGLLSAGYLLSARTLQYLLFVLVAPPLMLFGLPRWLLRRMIRGRVAFRVARLLTRPLVPLLVYNAVLVAVHLPPVVAGARPAPGAETDGVSAAYRLLVAERVSPDGAGLVFHLRAVPDLSAL
jgi:putative membrane protein